MEMATKRQCGNWINSGNLGEGSFGSVLLWMNQETNQKIAVKICKNAMKLSTKNKHRWHEEVRFLNEIDHQNIIQAFPLPEELKSFVPSTLPLLCMEYCEGGDLRKTLSIPENCCGLKQTMILKVCGDIAKAIQCLHKLGITHRDLKPENIVISNADKGVICKVIDLGYAKQLDPSHSVNSVVGTQCYLAPEIATGDTYSKTVDYWSYGILIYECCTGNRPFPKDIFGSCLEEKTWKHISASLDDEIELKPTFYEKLPPVNRLNSVLRPKFEKLLRLLLDFCPVKRGGKVNNDGIHLWFECVQEILATKVIEVFCIDSCSQYTYEQTPNMSLSDLTKSIHNDTEIPADHQELFLTNGTHDLSSLSSLQSKIHVFNKALIPDEREMDSCHDQVSSTLTEMLYDPDGFSYHSLNRHIKACKHSVFYVQNQLDNNSCLKACWGALMIRLVHPRHLLGSKNDSLRQTVTKLKTNIGFHKLSLDIDMKSYKTFCDKSVSCEELWKHTVESWKEKERLFNENGILNSFLQDEADVIFNENVRLQNTIAKMKNDFSGIKTPMRLSNQLANSRANEVLEKYGQMKKQAKSCFKEKIGYMRSTIHMFIEENKKITHGFYLFLRDLVDLRQQIKIFIPKLEKCEQKAMKLSKEVEQVSAFTSNTMQEERQEQLWKMLPTPLKEETNKPVAVEHNKQYSRVTPSFHKSPTRNIIQQSQTLVARVKETLLDAKEQQEMFQVQSQSLDWSFCE